MTHFASIDELEAAVGGPEESSRWVLIDQARIDAFAGATDDHQWIHVDAERAAAGPFRTTIAHGFLTLSLLASLLPDLLSVEGLPTVVNYGLDRVRFVTPVPSGGRVRAHAAVARVERTERGVRVSENVRVELEGSEKPALIAETIMLLTP